MKITIASGKGGTGKTFVSTNLFFSIQKEGIPVTLVDCDAEEPNVMEFFSGILTEQIPIIQKIPVIHEDSCTYCDKCREYCNYNAIICLPQAKHIQVLEDLCHDCGACLAACKYNAITEKEKTLGHVSIYRLLSGALIVEGRLSIGVYSPVPVIKGAMHHIHPDGITLFDAPPGISCPFIATADKADYIVLVTEPTPFGLNDLKLSAQTLDTLQKSYGVVINRSGLGDNSIYEWLEEKGIPILAEIPFDKEIARVYSEGRLIAEVDPGYRYFFTNLYRKIQNHAGNCSSQR